MYFYSNKVKNRCTHQYLLSDRKLIFRTLRFITVNNYAYLGGRSLLQHRDEYSFLLLSEHYLEISEFNILVFYNKFRIRSGESNWCSFKRIPVKGRVTYSKYTVGKLGNKVNALVEKQKMKTHFSCFFQCLEIRHTFPTHCSKT